MVTEFVNRSLGFNLKEQKVFIFPFLHFHYYNLFLFCYKTLEREVFLTLISTKKHDIFLL